MRKVMSAVFAVIIALSCAGSVFAADIKELTAAAEAGDAEAQYQLGVAYYDGVDVEQDFAKSFQWYLKAAEQGNVEAQCNLALLYDRGEGVEMDTAKAVEWYTKAAEQGDVRAQYIIGLVYYNGESVKEDIVTAYMWWIVGSMIDPGNERIEGALEGIGEVLSSAQIKEAELRAKAKFEKIKRNIK